MAVDGDIATEARFEVPVTWDALAKDGRYGDEFLQRKVDDAKTEVFGTVIDPDLETATYPPRVVEYAGKVAALKIIPPGAEYWSVQKTTDSSGNRVQAAWVDRVEKLWQRYDRLRREVDAMGPEIAELIGTTVRIARRTPPIRATKGINDEYLTPNPDDLPRQVAVPTTARPPANRATR